jgi:DNA modification methylase
MTVRILVGDCRTSLKSLPDQSVNCCVTSPPYFGLRDYGHDKQIGLEATPAEFVSAMVEVFRDVRRVLRDDGTLWLNLGDSYAGSWGSQGRDYSGISGSALSARQIMAAQRKERNTGSVAGSGFKAKDLMMIPARVAIALQDDGWYLRSDIIWHKPNPMPESVTDRPSSAHEHVFLLAKSARYFYDADAVRIPAAESSISRWEQNVDAQHGSERANGGAKTNGTMKAVGGPRAEKVRGLTPRHEGCVNHTGIEETPRGMGANLRNVWTVATRPFSGAHFATFPTELIDPCVKAGCPAGGTVLDPFGGAGTTGLVADRLQRNAILCELNPAYAEIARNRISVDQPMFSSVEVEAA